MTVAKNHSGRAPADDGRPHFAAPTQAAQDGAPFTQQIRMAYDLLQTAIEEAADAVGTQNVKIATELEALQERALRSVQDSALATIELLEALGAVRTPSDLARSQIELAHRQRESVHARLADFFQTAKGMAALMADPLGRQLQTLSGVMAPPAPRGGDQALEKLKSLTARQKRVLGLVGQGLPNKVIAHQLGISETTVKAHVGEILRKLGVYNRARAIVMLSQIDPADLQDLAEPAGDGI
jgi:DNA-binding CsgD family transcriptional regulator